MRGYGMPIDSDDDDDDDDVSGDDIAHVSVSVADDNASHDEDDTDEEQQSSDEGETSRQRTTAADDTDEHTTVTDNNNDDAADVPMAIDNTTTSRTAAATAQGAASHSPWRGVDTLAVLQCAYCHHPITSASGICAARDVCAWQQHVYAYEHDIFSNDNPVWMYSATNPQQRRFDVVRIDACVPSLPNDNNDDDDNMSSSSSSSSSSPRAMVVDVGDVYSSEHSFFVGYDWSMASCVNCGGFLGWSFATHERVVAAAAAAAAAVTTPAHDNGDGADTEAKQPQHAHDTATTRNDDDDAAAHDDGSATAMTTASATTTATAAVVDVTTRSLRPDFVGIIVTHCTGCDVYPAPLFAHAMRSLAHTRTRAAHLTGHHRQLRRCLPLVNNLFAGHLIATAMSVVHTVALGEWLCPYAPFTSADGADNSIASHNNNNDNDNNDDNDNVTPRRWRLPLLHTFTQDNLQHTARLHVLDDIDDGLVQTARQVCAFEAAVIAAVRRRRAELHAHDKDSSNDDDDNSSNNNNNSNSSSSSGDANVDHAGDAVYEDVLRRLGDDTSDEAVARLMRAEGLTLAWHGVARSLRLDAATQPPQQLMRTSVLRHRVQRLLECVYPSFAFGARRTRTQAADSDEDDEE